MRRRPQDLNENFPPTKLYLDDLERIHRILQEGRDEPVQITSGAYEFDGVADLRKLGEKVSELHMRASQVWESESFTLLGGRLSVFATPDTGEASRKVRDIREVIEPRRRPFAAFFSRPPWKWMNIGPGVGLGLMSLAIWDAPGGVAWVFIGAFLTMASIILGGLYLLYSSGGSIIYTVPIEERPGWWKRNKDHLLIELGVGLILVVVGFLLGYCARGTDGS